jgi:hypothetical protein
LATEDDELLAALAIVALWQEKIIDPVSWHRAFRRISSPNR